MARCLLIMYLPFLHLTCPNDHLLRNCNIHKYCTDHGFCTLCISSRIWYKTKHGSTVCCTAYDGCTMTTRCQTHIHSHTTTTVIDSHEEMTWLSCISHDCHVAHCHEYCYQPKHIIVRNISPSQHDACQFCHEHHL